MGSIVYITRFEEIPKEELELTERSLVGNWGW
jgi:hypothetical protein